MKFTGQITVRSHHMALVTDKHPAGPANIFMNAPLLSMQIRILLPYAS